LAAAPIGKPIGPSAAARGVPAATTATGRNNALSNRVLKVAQIGCGAFAADQDLRNFRESENIECVWCCDVDEARARDLARQFDVPNVTTDSADCVNDPAVDFLKIATSHEVHLPIIEAAAAAGKHVFCEKPMALELEEGLKIIRAVRRNGIKLCVDLNRRMSPALQALRDRWRRHHQDPTHQPWRFVEMERDLYPEEELTHFLVRVQDDTLSYRIAHLDPLRGGGEILGESVHWLDLACWLFSPQRPVEVLAWGSARFRHGMYLTFSHGDAATIIFNCGGTFDYPKEMFEIASKGALFRSRFFVENEYYGIPGLDRETFPLRRDCLPDVGTEGGFDGWMAKYRARVEGLTNSKEGHAELSVDKGHKAMLDAFVRAILEDKPSPCGEMAGYLSTYLALQAIRSIETRQSLPIPVDRVVFDVS